MTDNEAMARAINVLTYRLAVLRRDATFIETAIGVLKANIPAPAPQAERAQEPAGEGNATLHGAGASPAGPTREECEAAQAGIDTIPAFMDRRKP